MNFANRHIGPVDADVDKMLRAIDAADLDELIEQTIPEPIRFEKMLDLPDALSEVEVLDDLREIAEQNRVMRSMIGQGYYDTRTPNVILRNILEDPGWYTAYTCLLYTSPSPRDRTRSRMPSSA